MNFVLVLWAFSIVGATATNARERLAVCSSPSEVLGNTTLEANGYAIRFKIFTCPPLNSGTNLDERSVTENLTTRQTCTQCPCANCSDTPGESGNSLLIDSCSHEQPPDPSRPVAADCKTLSYLMTTGVPAVPNPPSFPMQTHIYYTDTYLFVIINSILSWEYQGCGFAFFNDVGTTFNVCATDLANSVNALIAYCPNVEDIEGLLQNNPSMSLLVYNPVEIHG
ncbi:hypothetical protein C8R45DRAFT_1100931 [Mycena sanguinolenta]|nr:hypothetical protein C8R45DRAFT_1100931 [Mycena sanguinolenta]